MTNDADLQPAVAAEFLALAGLLDSAAVAQWDTPSLCAGWRVREVIAHMTMAARYSEEEFMAELRRCDFDFGRLSNELAARDAAGRRVAWRAQSRGHPRPGCDGAAGRAAPFTGCHDPGRTGRPHHGRCTGTLRHQHRGAQPAGYRP